MQEFHDVIDHWADTALAFDLRSNLFHNARIFAFDEFLPHFWDCLLRQRPPVLVLMIGFRVRERMAELR